MDRIFTIEGRTYRFRKNLGKGGGYDIYLRGVWIAWTAGTLTDAKQTATEMGRKLNAQEKN